MPQPRANNTIKWYSKKYTQGYVENRRGIAHARHSDDMCSLRIRFVPENEKKAVRMLDEWLDLKINNPEEYQRQRTKQLTKSEPVTTVYEIYKEYMQARMSDKTDANRRRMNAAMRFWFPTDCPLDYDTIYPALLKRVSEHTFTAIYFTKLLQMCSRVMEYAVARGILPRNPVALIEKPKVVTHEPEIFQPEEIERILEFFNEPLPKTYHNHKSKTERKRHWGRCIKLMHITGMRVSEAIGLKKSDVFDDHFLIHGKGDYYREFPTSQFPEVQAILRESMDYAQGTKLFNISSDKLRGWFNLACEVKDVPREINGRKRTLHKLRATAEHHFEHEMQLPAHVVADIAGHSLTTYKKHYRKRMKATTLDKFIKAAVEKKEG